MADGRHLEKLKTAVSPQRFDRSDAFWPSEGHGHLQFSTFKNPRWRTAAILKIEKGPYFRNGSTDLHKIWQNAAF